MIIEEIYEEAKEPFWDNESLEIIVDGKTVVNIGHVEPEDAILSRDLSFAFDIIDLMSKAYEAGKNGEELIIK